MAKQPCLLGKLIRKKEVAFLLSQFLVEFSTASAAGTAYVIIFNSDIARHLRFQSCGPSNGVILLGFDPLSTHIGGW